MSRKASIPADEKETWNRIRAFVISNGFGPMKRQPSPDAFAHSVVVLVDAPSPQTEAFEMPFAAPLSYMPTAHRILQGDTNNASSVVVLDLAPLRRRIEFTPSDSLCLEKQEQQPKNKKRSKHSNQHNKKSHKNTWQDTIRDETCICDSLGKTLGRPVAKTLTRLSFGSSGLTLVASGSLAALALKLIRTPDLHASQSGISRVLLIEPQIEPYAINALLTNNKALPQRDVVLDVIYSDKLARESRAPILRAVFKNGFDLTASEECLDNVAASFLSNGQQDADLLKKEVHSQGTRLWCQELKVEMNKFSKQLERTLHDVTEELYKPTALKQPKLEKISSQPHAGALILRGDRCILVRCLREKKRWTGMRVPAIPWCESDPLETAARRAIEAACEIDVEDQLDQLLPLKDIPPFALYHSEAGVTTVQLFMATHAPPDVPIEEDEDDLYDWYTLTQALDGRVDSPTAAFLKTVAFALDAAHAAGRLESKWGGVFGQEIVTNHTVATELGPWKMVQAAKERKKKPIPVTVLSGFLGAGKTTTMTHVLTNRAKMRVAVVVNDMGDVNVDANLLRAGGESVVHQEETMVELSNGCICCTLREDLLSTLVSLAMDERNFDYILVESSGISEPLPVAETFTFVDTVSGASLSDVARLDTLVSVVDASVFESELHSKQTLTDRAWERESGDERTIAQLLVDQVEFANVIIVNKCDLLPNPETCDSLKDLIRHLNPMARIIETTRGEVHPSEILDTGLFTLEEAAEHPQWLVEDRFGGHTPETVEYGIGSFTFRSRKPFHAGRFKDLLDRVCASRTTTLQQSSDPTNDRLLDPLSAIVRGKGIVYLATDLSRDVQGIFSLAGRVATVTPGPPWWASIDREDWPDGLAEAMKPLWDNSQGDRQNEIVIIGVHLEKERVIEALERCLLTEEEAAVPLEDWETAFPDPFFQTCSHHHGHHDH